LVFIPERSTTMAFFGIIKVVASAGLVHVAADNYPRYLQDVSSGGPSNGPMVEPIADSATVTTDTGNSDTGNSGNSDTGNSDTGNSDTGNSDTGNSVTEEVSEDSDTGNSDRPDVSEACEAACPGLNASITGYMTEAIAAGMMSENRLRRLNGHEMRDDGDGEDDGGIMVSMRPMLEMACPYIDDIMCMESNRPGDCGEASEGDDDGSGETQNMCTCASTCSMSFLGAFDQIMATFAMTEEADKHDKLCPVEATATCIAGTSACPGGGNSSDPMIATVVALLAGCEGNWTPRALSVALTMELTVADPAGFVANPASQAAVATGIASAAGVSIDKVDVTLTVARRLQNLNRRLQGGTVNVAATIEADSAGALASLTASVAAIPADTMATSLNTQLEAAGIEAVTVASLAAVDAPPPMRQTELPALPTFENPTAAGPGTGSSESSASQLRCLALFLPAVVLMFSV